MWLIGLISGERCQPNKQNNWKRMHLLSRIRIASVGSIVCFTYIWSKVCGVSCARHCGYLSKRDNNFSYRPAHHFFITTWRQVSWWPRHTSWLRRNNSRKKFLRGPFKKYIFEYTSGVEFYDKGRLFYKGHLQNLSRFYHEGGDQKS